ncbi:hypothetical protein [Roseateles sp.]|uniref:hypothetical protein n=1 Tax=Roseateles sp. TaxID=1971397 RepID=UPI0031E3D8DA
MYRSFARLIVAALFGIACAWSAQAQIAKPDSTQLTAQPPLQPSHCPNLVMQWYAAGSVPAGYYKANSDGNCYPIPSCPSNQVWNGGSQVCACPSGTAWDGAYSTCHGPCGGGTAWNGSSCASICTGGQTWKGSACACPVGTAWNGSTCGAPPAFTGFSASPTAQTIGSGGYVLSWSTSGGPTSGSITCSGANGGSFALSPVSGGSGSIAVNAPGTTNCTGSVSNSYGSASSTTIALTANCPGGTSWNGSSCGSLCSGGQVWNGSACACPSGQVWNGSSCGYAPVFTGFSVSPTAVNVGSNYGVSWSTSGSGPVTVTMNCSGATSASYTLSPPAGGSGAVTAAAPGTTNCSASAASPWGSTSASSGALTAVCPSGQQWNAASQTCVAAVPTLAVTGFQLVDPSGVVLQTQPAAGAVFNGGLYRLSSNNNCAGGRPMAINMLNQDWNKGINRTVRTVVTGGTPPLKFAYYFTPGAGYTNKDFDFVNGNPYDSQGINYLNANNLPWNSGGYTGPFTGYNDSWGGYNGDLSRPFATRSGYLKGAPSMTVSVVVTDSAGQSVTGTYVTGSSTSVEPYGPSCTAM